MCMCSEAEMRITSWQALLERIMIMTVMLYKHKVDLNKKYYNQCIVRAEHQQL